MAVDQGQKHNFDPAALIGSHSMAASVQHGLYTCSYMYVVSVVINY